MNKTGDVSTPSSMQALALFDLDNTLLTGDSEVLWVDYLLARGELGAGFAERNAEMDRRYTEGVATPQEFCAFYASTFAGRTPAAWAPLRAEFVATVIRPRLPAAAFDLVEQHRMRGDLLVLTSAATRFLSEPTAEALGFDHLIATELAQAPADDGGEHGDQHGDQHGNQGGNQCGPFTGDNRGLLNMREGKVARLRAWLAARGETAAGIDAALAAATFYSDSINDLPLMLAVGRPVAVDPDLRLLAEAESRGWPVLRLLRTPPASVGDNGGGRSGGHGTSSTPPGPRRP